MTTFAGSILSLPEDVAAEQGFFKANGLDVTMVPVTSGPASAQALLSGSANIMLNTPDFVLQAQDKGQQVKIVAGDTVRGVTTVLVRKGWPVPDAGSYPAVIKDLKGAKIGVTARGATTELEMRLMLTDAGLNPDKDVTFIATGLVATSLPALQAKQIDAWVGFEPGTTLAVDQQKIADPIVDLRKGQGPSELVNYSTNVFAASTGYISSHGDVIQRFANSIQQAQSWIANSANRSALEATVAKDMQVSAALIPELLNDNLATFGAAVPEGNIQNAIDLNKQFKLISGSPTYDSVVATQYVPK